MKNIFSLLVFSVLCIILNGCAATSPEHYEELTEKECTALRHAARALALRGNAVPEHLRNAFIKLAPLERIVYDGNKHGKASYRWEIYEKRSQNKRLQQKDVNPYWVMVYAIGDLRDPSWKLSHTNQNSMNNMNNMNNNQQSPARRQYPQRSRQVRQVRYNN